MKTEVNPKDTSRAEAFELWMSSPMPMVTLTKTFDVNRLCRYAKKHGVKFNMLLCWCIGNAASQVPEFMMLPVEDKMYQFDELAIGPVVNKCTSSIGRSKTSYAYHPVLQLGHDSFGGLQDKFKTSYRF